MEDSPTMPDAPPEPLAPPLAECQAGRVRLAGAWTVTALSAHGDPLPAGELPTCFDASALGALDTTGALLLVHAEGRCAGAVAWEGLRDEHAELLDLVRRHRHAAAPHADAASVGVLALLGRDTCRRLAEARDILAFLGEACVACWRALLLPHRLRLTPLLANVQRAGFEALPIVGLLSFLMGIVIAYQGGQQLRTYGASLFVVDLVTLTMLREMAVILTAIIVAGRTGSAYTAQIGTMRVTEEIDALRTIGIRPLDLLVVPKIFALVLVLPLLTVYADMMGVFGGMFIADLMFGVSFTEFLQRLEQVVSLRHFLVGVGKAPVFALLIALVGCYQGFKVSGGADAVGRQTTVSVVQAIFLVIVVDAAFSVLFSALRV